MQFNHTATVAGAGPGVDAGAGNTYKHLGMKVTSAAPDCVVNLETSPDGTTWTVADVVTGGNRWALAGLHTGAQHARSNVVNLGTAGLPISTTLTGTS
jgi:hypothetical protein